MIYTDDIIKHNLSQLESAVENFNELKDLISLMDALEDEFKWSKLSQSGGWSLGDEIAQITVRLQSSSIILPYFNFLKWKKGIEDFGYKIIYDNIDFKFVKNEVIKHSDIKVANIFSKFGKKRFNALLMNSDRIDSYSGHYYSKRRRYSQFSFSKSESLLMNWVIQNKLDITGQFRTIGQYYINPLPKVSLSWITKEENNKRFLESFNEFISSYTDSTFLNMNLHNELFNKMTSTLLEKFKSAHNKVNLVKCVEEVNPFEIGSIHQVSEFIVSQNDCICGAKKIYDIKYTIDKNLYSIQHFKPLVQHRSDLLTKIFKETD